MLPTIKKHLVLFYLSWQVLSVSRNISNCPLRYLMISFFHPTSPSLDWVNFCWNSCIIPQWEETLTFNENSSRIIKPSTIFFFEVIDFIDSCNSDTEYSSIGWHRIAWAFLKPVTANDDRNVGRMLRLQLYQSDTKNTSINKSNVPYVSVFVKICDCRSSTTAELVFHPQVYNWYRKKRWKSYPSTLYVTIRTIPALNVDSRPRQRSCTPLQPEIGSDSSVKSLALFSNGDDEVDAKSPATSSAVYRLVRTLACWATYDRMHDFIEKFLKYVE